MSSSAAPPYPITKDQALAIARKVVADLSDPHDFVLQPEQTVERSFGWVFFYNTRPYLQTGDRAYLVPGSAPLVVLRADGATEFLATSVPPQRAIEIYEQNWLLKQAAEVAMPAEGKAGDDSASENDN